jgi:uncharacterized metal-binding protein
MSTLDNASIVLKFLNHYFVFVRVICKIITIDKLLVVIKEPTGECDRTVLVINDRYM